MEFGKRLRSRIWRGSVDEEVDAEFEFHVEMRVRELVAGGMEPSAARQAAIKRFGDINRVNATCRCGACLYPFRGLFAVAGADGTWRQRKRSHPRGTTIRSGICNQ